MGDKKRNGKWIWPMSFLWKEVSFERLLYFILLYYGLPFFLIQRARGDSIFQTVLWIIFPEASVFSDLNSDRNYFKESRRQCTPVEFCSNSNWNSNYKSKWLVSSIEGFQTFYNTFSNFSCRFLNPNNFFQFEL